MKIAKKTCLFVFGFLSALALSGCINPISAALPGSEPAAGSEPGADTTITAPQPFTVTITVGADGRAAAGAEVEFIKSGSIRNFMQLIVVNKSDGTVHTLTDAWQTDSGNGKATLAVEAISYGLPYEFLLLMGHWERDYAAENDGKYEYTDGPPTLLAAGLKEATITGGDNTVKITLWPIVVDTKFTGGTTKQPVTGTTTELASGDWNLEWTVLNGKSGNGFEQLIAAQQAIGGGDTLEYKSLKTIVRQGDVVVVPTTGPQIAGNKITQNIGDFTKTANATGSANFNLEYVPFGKTNYDWSGFNEKSKFDLSGGSKPVWIIRNGVNDEPQNGDTTFADSDENPAVWGGTKNGNGAVAFKVNLAAAVPPSPGTGDNAAIDEQDLLKVLGVTTVADAIEELHERISSGNMGGLKLGMYLDLPSLTPAGESKINWSSTYENLRIVIASFNQYKGTTNTEDHIKFVFKNSPVQKKMRNSSSNYNYGGYPYANDDGTHGTPELKEYLEDAFFTGLKAALGGSDYFYEVTRNITGGSSGAWKKVPFKAAIFIDTEMEVFGTNGYNKSTTEEDLTQTALYAQGGAKSREKKYNSVSLPGLWWVASPYSGSTTQFTVVWTDGTSSVTSAGTAYGVAPAFCIY